jgi:hypothetical protein
VQKSKLNTPVFTKQAGWKGNVHDAGWFSRITAAISASVPESWKRLGVVYHGVPPVAENVLTNPIEARPPSTNEIVEPADVEVGESAVADLQRDIGNDPPPVHPAMKR